MNSPSPSDESQRLQEVRRYAILDTPPEAAFERLTRLAARLFNVPITFINLIDEDRQWFKSCYGLDMREAPRARALCAHAILTDEVLVVTDARQDARFADSPIVTGAEGVRFYAGAPLQSPDGLNIGTFAVMDRVPREMNDAEIATLSDLAALAVDEMELRLAATALRDESGEERRQATLELQRREEHFRSLIENASDIIAVVDGDGTIRYQSSSVERVLGYKADGLIGRSAFEWIHPDDAGIVQEALRLIFSHPGAVQTAQYRFRHQDGSWRVMEAVGKAVPGDSTAGAVINSRDITTRKEAEASLRKAHDELEIRVTRRTDALAQANAKLHEEIAERKRAEYSLRESEERFRSVTEAIPQQVWTAQPDGALDYVNQRVLDYFARTFEEMIGWGWAELIHPDDVPECMARWQHSLQTGELYEIEFRLCASDGAYRWNLGRALPLRDEQGRIVKWFGTNTDISERKQAEAALQESEGRFRRVMEQAADAFFIIDGEARFVDVNERACTSLGYAREELLTLGVNDIDAASKLEIFRSSWNATLEGGAVTRQGVHLRKDGTTFPVEIRASVFEFGGERLMLALARDITVRQEAEASLRASEERYRTIVNTSQEGIWLLDTESKTSFVNQRMAAMLGYEPEEMMGRSMYDFMDEAARLEAQQNVERRQQNINEHHDFRFQRKDSSILWTVVAASSLFSEDGQYLGALGMVTDITARKETEEALRESEARKGAILETALDCIITIDGEGKVLEWNPAAEDTFGYSRAQATGQLLGDLIVPEALRERHYQGIAHYLATGDGPLLNRRVEVPALRADGSELLVELSITAIVSDGPTVFTAYVRDITARKQIEEALKAAKTEAERANRAKSEFMSRMSHELRTPLNAILGFGQLLEMDELDAEQTQGVEQILKAGRHLLELINEVLDIARIESEQQVVEIEPVPVVETLTGALDMVRPLAATRGIEVRDDCGTDADLFVLADRRRLNQVLLNLLANAVKYNREGGVATLSYAATEAGRLRIAVSDTGLGLAPDKLDRLFTPFERLGAEESGIEGTGLGLALSKRLVEAMGGVITVESTPEIGSTFTVELPLAPEQTPLAAPLMEPLRAGRETAARQPVEAGETGAIVLYIEDNPANFGLVQNILRHRPEIKLLAAMHGLSGLELAQRHRPDLILLDYHLPDINGDEVLRRLREDASTRGIPIIVVSADATPHQIGRMQAAGAVEYLTKPLDVKRFLITLDEHLKGGH